ncbi:MAG: MFS transporter [Pirellulaceae bacterium]
MSLSADVTVARAGEESLPEQRPTRVRFLVLAFLCSLAFVLYLDRVCISQAIQPMQEELGLNESQFGVIFAAFTLAYGLFEIPTGHWADQLGSRRVLTRISIWWSVFTALTGACFGFYSLVVVRFLFGAGEAGAFPNAARVISRWFPPLERGRAQGMFQTTALIGGAGSQVLAAYLIRAIGWRFTFVVFGLVGIVWAVIFYWWFRDEPSDHIRVNEAERAIIGTGSTRHDHTAGIPWGYVLTHRGILLLATIMTCASFNSYVYFSWFSKYLQAGRGVEPVHAGWLCSLVLTLAALGTISGGVIADRVKRTVMNPLRWRRWWGFSAYVAAALFLIAGVMGESPLVMALGAAFSTAATHLTNPSWWSCATDVSGRHIGALFGLMNGVGVFGAMSSQLLFGNLAEWRKSQGFEGRAQWDPAFYVVAAVLLVAAVCWLFVDTSRPIGSAAEHDAPKNPA